MLSLKEQYKTKFGKVWAPGAVPQAPTQPQTPQVGEMQLLEQIAKQGDKVRDLKGKKADKATIGEEVKILLQLKEEFKKVTGKEWKPTMNPETTTKSAPSSGDNTSKETLVDKVTQQGDVVRDLKAKKASKVIFLQLTLSFNYLFFQEEIDKAVKSLLDLKAEYKNLTGEDFPAPSRAPSKPKVAKESKQPQPKPKPVPKEKAIVQVNLTVLSRLISISDTYFLNTD